MVRVAIGNPEGARKQRGEFLHENFGAQIAGMVQFTSITTNYFATLTLQKLIVIFQ
jgi:hypothetical protein